MWILLILVLSLGIGEVLAFPAADRTASQTKDSPCDDWACISEMEVLYDPVTKKCGCSWIPGLQPPAIIVVAQTINQITDPPPPTATPSISPCAAIRCVAGFHPVANTTDNTCKCVANDCSPKLICLPEKEPVFSPITSNCTCEWRPGFRALLSGREATPKPETHLNSKPICLAKCTVGYHSVQYPNGGCSCIKNAQPLPCGIRCKSQYILTTDLDTGECKCEPGPDYTPCNLKCDEGYHWATAFRKRAGSCVQNAALQPCPIRCTSASVLFFSPQTGKCSCVTKEKNCLDNTQYMEGPSVWNSTTETCTCVDESKKKEELCMLATSCVVGSQPVWDNTKKTCTCEPNPTGPEFTCLVATACIAGSIPVWDGTSQTCRCVNIQS